MSQKSVDNQKKINKIVYQLMVFLRFIFFNNLPNDYFKKSFFFSERYAFAIKLNIE